MEIGEIDELEIEELVEELREGSDLEIYMVGDQDNSGIKVIDTGSKKTYEVMVQLIRMPGLEIVAFMLKKMRPTHDFQRCETF